MTAGSPGSSASTVLRCLGLLPADSTVTPGPEAMNLLPPAVVGAVTSGSLTWDNGYPATSKSATAERMACFLGPGATLRGAAAVLAGLLSGLGGLTDDQSARALLTYSAEPLSLPGTDGWLVGRQLPLPVERAAGGGWVTDPAKLAAWASQCDDRWLTVLDVPAAALPFPDADADAADSAQAVAALTVSGGVDQGAVQALAAATRAATLTNPFAQVYKTFALLAALRAAPDGTLPAAAEALAAAFSPAEQNLLGTVTAGAGVLRRLLDVLQQQPATASAVTSMTQLAAALGFPSALTKLTDQGASPPPRELPMTDSQRNRPVQADRRKRRSDLNSERTDGVHVLVHGRDYSVGDITSYSDKRGRTYRGPTHPGTPGRSPGAFQAAHPELLIPTGLTGQALTTAQARLDLVSAIAGNEGMLDAARLLDSGLTSSGFEQWTTGGDDEGTVLLALHAALDPDHYDLHFRMAGLEVAITDTWLSDDFVRDATLQRLDPGTGAAAMPAADPQHLRRGFFGGTLSGGTLSFAPDWAARLRAASVCSRGYVLAQFQLAVHRFDRMRQDIAPVTVLGSSFGIDSLITSCHGVALLLDAHINLPAQVRPVLVAGAASVAAALTAQGQDVLTAGTLSDPFLTGLAGYFREHRQLADALVRTNRIDALGLPAANGSFQGWGP